MTESSNSRVNRDLIFFLLLTFALSWAVMGTIIFRGGMEKAGLLVLLVMWVPGAVSLTYRWVSGLGFRDVGWRLGSGRYWLLAIAVPFAVAALSYSILWLTGVNSFVAPTAEFLARKHLTSLWPLFLVRYPLAFAFGCVAALGEELGWRGFLIPKLTETSIKRPLIVSSVIWGTWHLPLILWGGYASSDLPVVSALLFMAMILCAGVFVGWLRMKSGSVWVAMIYHAAHNMFLQAAFEPFNQNGPLTQYLGGESGVVPTVVYIALIIIGYRLLARNEKTIGHDAMKVA